jgi:hypothetical protein
VLILSRNQNRGVRVAVVVLIAKLFVVHSIFVVCC